MSAVTLKDWLHEATLRLSKAGIETARLDAQVLAAFCLEKDRSWVIAYADDFPITESAGLEAALARREQREPLAYILGQREFYGLDFFVTPATLVPRQETETLVDAALPHCAPLAVVLDVGTGSGCVAVTIKKYRPECTVWASDISPDALEIARRNAFFHEASIRWFESDLLAEIPDNSVDLIVSNPPYVETQAPLMPEIALFEPHLALFGGEDGMEFYHRLLREAPRVLKPGGRLLVEIGDGQWDRIQALRPLNVTLEAYLDLNRTPRVVGFCFPS